MSNNIDIKELKKNLSKINKSGKLLLNDLEELYKIVEYIKLYKKRGFKINTILSLVNNNIYNTEEYLIQVIDETTKMNSIIQNNTNIITNNNNNITNSNENNFTELINNSNFVSTNITNNIPINISSNDSSDISAVSAVSNNSEIYSSQNINDDIILDNNDISPSKKKNKSKCCKCFKL